MSNPRHAPQSNRPAASERTREQTEQCAIKLGRSLIHRPVSGLRNDPEFEIRLELAEDPLLYFRVRVRAIPRAPNRIDLDGNPRQDLQQLIRHDERTGAQ